MSLLIKRIESGFSYRAAPTGQEPTTFRSIELRDRRVTFENPEHDYPQRIIYSQPSADQLSARIEGVEDGEQKSSVWRFNRSQCEPT